MRAGWDRGGGGGGGERTIAYALAKLTPISPEFAFGLFIAGCAPGGGASNVWTRLLGGDLDLSITMTLISSLAALGMFT
nr:unnamed protein product [Spirometra erinaceieuropaei]